MQTFQPLAQERIRDLKVVRNFELFKIFSMIRKSQGEEAKFARFPLRDLDLFAKVA